MKSMLSHVIWKCAYMDVMLFHSPVASTFGGCSLPEGSVSKVNGQSAFNQALLVLFV